MYFTPEQQKQVHDFVDDFIDKVSWLKEDDGLDMLADKAMLDDGGISEEYLCELFIMFAMDKMSKIGLEGEKLHDRVASSVLIWSMQSFNQEDRDALRPIYEKYLKE